MEKYNKQDLEKLILEQNKPYSFIGNLYGVSGAAIKKAAKKMGIPVPVRRVVNSKETFSHKGYKKNSLVNRISDEEFVEIIKNSTSWKEIGEKLGYKNGLSPNVKESVEARCSMLGMEPNIVQYDFIMETTKNELFGYRKNWQSARGTIQRIARQIYLESNPNPK